MCPSALRVCSEPGGQKPVLSLSLDRIYGIEGPSKICTQSAEARLAVSGAKPLFTLGLLMFALSPVDFLSLLLSLSTDINIFFYFCQNYHLKDT